MLKQELCYDTIKIVANQNKTDNVSNIKFNMLSAWYELIYCILAGTKVSTEIVHRSYSDLLCNAKSITFSHICLYPELCKSKISLTLKISGYRFYQTKAETIVNAARFYLLHYAEILSMNKDKYEIRELLVDGVKGIGIKISSHWLRNIGYQTPIIDIHVRRILYCGGFTNIDYRDNFSEKEYLVLENIMYDISKKINIPVSELDYALWLYGRNNCTNCTCSGCPIKNEK